MAGDGQKIIDGLQEAIECNQPFERLPQCACDPGCGAPPSRLQMLECKMRGGPCRESDEPQTAQEVN